MILRLHEMASIWTNTRYFGTYRIGEQRKHICAVSPEPVFLACTQYKSRKTQTEQEYLYPHMSVLRRLLGFSVRSVASSKSRLLAQIAA